MKNEKNKSDFICMHKTINYQQQNINDSETTTTELLSPGLNIF